MRDILLRQADKGKKKSIALNEEEKTTREKYKKALVKEELSAHGFSELDSRFPEYVKRRIQEGDDASTIAEALIRLDYSALPQVKQELIQSFGSDKGNINLDRYASVILRKYDSGTSLGEIAREVLKEEQKASSIARMQALAKKYNPLRIRHLSHQASTGFNTEDLLQYGEGFKLEQFETRVLGLVNTQPAPGLMNFGFSEWRQHIDKEHMEKLIHLLRDDYDQIYLFKLNKLVDLTPEQIASAYEAMERDRLSSSPAPLDREQSKQSLHGQLVSLGRLARGSRIEDVEEALESTMQMLTNMEKSIKIGQQLLGKLTWSGSVDK
ncbi:MAG: hypothetical protein F6K10_42600, partial [Moorea sp. SIO2B7]|nr:hypothetical protein [Moorena sp. SIO2B7]